MILDLAGRAADVPRARDRDDARRARTRRSRAARSASMIAIKQLGTNGGGYYNSNSAVPFENPNGALELPRDARDPADPGRAGVHVREDGARAPARLGALRGRCFAIFAIGVADRASRPSSTARQVLRNSGVNITQEHGQSGGNMADKEVRFGIANTALWATATTDAPTARSTAATTRSRPPAAPCRLSTCSSARSISGGVGSGLYGMFFYILIAVFVAGLMVGRTPEWLGKKIEAREIKLAAVGALFVPTMVLVDDGRRDRDAGRARVDLQPRRARLHARRSTRTRRSRTTTAARSPATARRPSRRRSARSRSTSAASSRCSPRSRSAARSRRRRSCPRRRGRSAPTARPSASCSLGVIALTAGLMILPALTLGPIVEGLMH